MLHPTLLQRSCVHVSVVLVYGRGKLIDPDAAMRIWSSPIGCLDLGVQPTMYSACFEGPDRADTSPHYRSVRSWPFSDTLLVGEEGPSASSLDYVHLWALHRRRAEPCCFVYRSG